MSASSAPSPLEDLASRFDEWKYGPGKNISIVRSSSAIVSTAASALLVWIIIRSPKGIKTTYHRLLLGLSAFDILWSLSLATFGAVVPSELSYFSWNARGSQASCDAFGFLNMFGAISGLLYMCSLNLYYLAKVRFNKTDSYIAKKLEPSLHLVPTLIGLIVSVVILALEGMNADVDGVCVAMATHEFPHCDGYEDGDTPEGFEIPCGRGRSAGTFVIATGMIILFIVPVTIGGSLWTIYRAVSRAERRVMQRYGVGTLQINHAQHTTNDAATPDVEEGDSRGRGAFSTSIISIVSSRFGGRISTTNTDREYLPKSRAVLQKAAAYSIAYFVTWIWTLIAGGIVTFKAWTLEDIPQSTWQVAYRYVWYFFVPLQGLWTFLIYMQPNVIKRKRSSEGNISWFRAFADALWTAVTGRTHPPRRGRDRAGPGAPRTAAAPFRTTANPNLATPQEIALPTPPPQEKALSTVKEISMESAACTK